MPAPEPTAATPPPPGAELRLRPARDDDGGAIGALIAGVFADYPGCVFEPAEFPELTAPATAFAAGGGRLWVIEDPARSGVAGSFGILQSPEPGIFTLHKVYLAAELRGRGLAGRLLAEATAFARAAGGTELRLWTDTRFAAGHRFYEKNGFVRAPLVRFLADASDSWEFAYRRPLGGGVQ